MLVSWEQDLVIFQDPACLRIIWSIPVNNVQVSALLWIDPPASSAIQRSVCMGIVVISGWT